MATLAETRTLIRQGISQVDATASDFSDAELNGFVDQGVRFLGALVKKPTKRTSFQVTVNISTYAIASFTPDLIIPTKAYFGDTSIPGDVLPLRIIPEEELAELSPAWLDAHASSQGRPIYLIKDGANLLIYPRPNADQSATGKKVYVSHVYQPADSVESVELDLPVVFHDLVVQYGTHLCYLGKLNNLKQATTIKQQIEKDAKRLEGLIVKESESPGFYWGTSISPDDEWVGVLVP